MINKYIPRKEKIVFSIIDLINEIGIKDLSVKEIAKRENITEAALYKHFKSKEQMLLEVLVFYSKYDINITNTLNKNGKDEKENLLNYFKLYAEYYESYPALTAITASYNVLLYEDKIGVKIKEIINKRSDFVKTMIEEGQKNKKISQNITSENLTCILMGTFNTMIFSWRLKNYDFSLKEKIIEIISEILKMY